MMYGYHGGMGWIGMLVGGFFFLLLVAGLVSLIVMAVRGGRRHGMGWYPPPMGPSGAGAKEILQMRYAKGEITKEQYKEMLADLES